MAKKRKLKNIKNALKKVRNLERRKGDDWAVFDKKSRLSSRKQGKIEVKEQKYE